MKEAIQDCFLGNGSLLAKRPLCLRVQGGWGGTCWKRAVTVGCRTTTSGGGPEAKQLQRRKQKGWKDPGEMKKVKSPRHGDRLEMGHGAGQNLGWTLRLLTWVTGWVMMAFNRSPWERPQLLPSPWLMPPRPPSPKLCLLTAPHFCTLRSLAQQWLSPLPGVCLIKCSTFKLNSVVHSKNVPWLWVLPPGHCRSFS